MTEQVDPREGFLCQTKEHAALVRWWIRLDLPLQHLGVYERWVDSTVAYHPQYGMTYRIKPCSTQTK